MGRRVGKGRFGRQVGGQAHGFVGGGQLGGGQPRGVVVHPENAPVQLGGEALQGGVSPGRAKLTTSRPNRCRRRRLVPRCP